MIDISIIILTFNSEETLAATLESACQVSDDIHTVDSFSTDETLEIAKGFGVHVVQHEFVNYSAQRNWAIDNLPIKYPWELHLDSDEKLSTELIKEIVSLEGSIPDDVDGYFIPRLVRFMGRLIRHGGMYPIWHMRLFRHGEGRCENRKYDQHFFVKGKTRQLKNPMIDDNRMSLDKWIYRHNRWASAEVEELVNINNSADIVGQLSRNPIERKRFFKKGYYSLPLFIRPFLLFTYRYIFRLGLLDGKEGVVFFVLQTLWFRFLVDAKLFEKRLRINGNT